MNNLKKGIENSWFDRILWKNSFNQYQSDFDIEIDLKDFPCNY